MKLDNATRDGDDDDDDVRSKGETIALLPSAIHELTSPLLLTLVHCEEREVIGRIGEGLQRVAQGLSKNPSIVSQELLLYVYSTLQPFVQSLTRSQKEKRSMEGRLESFVDEVHEDTAELPSYLNEEESSDDELFVNQPNKKQLDKKRKRGMKGNNVGFVWIAFISLMSQTQTELIGFRAFHFVFLTTRRYSL